MRKLLTILFAALALSGWSCQSQCTQGNVTNIGTCPNQVSAIVLTPFNPSVPVGSTITFTATWQLGSGALSNIATSQCAWASDNTSVATIPANIPIATGVSAGTANISCTAAVSPQFPSGIVGSIALTVTAAPQITNPQSNGCANPCPIPNGANGVAYSFTFAAVGGKTPYTWSLSAGNFNACLSGVSFTSGGVLTGTGTTATCTPTVQVTDSLSNSTTLQVSLTITASAGCGTPPNYCARTDTAVSSGSTVNSGNPPANLKGLNGAGNTVTDDNNSGPAAACVGRITDYAMVQSNLTSPATNTFSVTSSSTSRAWNSNTTIFYGDTIGGGQTAFFNYTGSCAASLVGVAGHDSSGGGGVKFGGAEFSTTNPLLFYSGGAANGGAARATLNQYLQDGTTGAGSWGTAHITATTRLDPINCPGLTSYNSGALGNYWNRYLALSLADGSVGTGSTPVQAGDYRFVQDQSSLIITYDPSQAGHGCRWLDLKSGQVGGDYGSSGLTTGFGPLPAPVAPSVSVQGTNATGSLILGHTYAVQTTYAVVGTGNVYSGESTPSPVTLAAVSGFCFLGGVQVSCGLFVTPPAANPGGGSGINLTMTAQAFNAYVCDRTANPSCTPSLQTNSTNASGTLAQPVITSITGCAAGSTSYTFYVIAKNTGGESIPSAGVTVNSVKDSATGSIHCVINYATVANATSYDATVDSLNTFAGNFANSSCSGGACAQTVNLGVGINTSSYAVASNPIATTPVIASLSTTSPQPPTINMAGPMFHNLRMEPSGQWIVISVANSFSILQPGAVKAPMGYLWHISTNALIPCGQGIQSLPYASYCMQHWTHHNGTMFATLTAPNATALAQTTFNDNTATMNGSTVFLGLSQEALDTQSGDEHLSGNYLAGPIFRDGYPISNPYVLPSVPYNGELIAYPLSGGAPFRFCHTWDSGAQGFYSTPRGNVSQDGMVMIFESDNLRNGNGTQGTASGNGSFGGANTCTAGLTSPSTNACRYDIYVCQLK